MAHSYVRHDSFICVTCLIHMCDMTYSYVWHDSSMFVSRLIHIRDMTQLLFASDSMCHKIHCSVLQCVAVCCSVLQCAAVCCSVLLFASDSMCHKIHCSVLQCAAVCCSVLLCVAVCCSVLQCVAVCCCLQVTKCVTRSTWMSHFTYTNKSWPTCVSGWFDLYTNQSWHPRVNEYLTHVWTSKSEYHKPHKDACDWQDWGLTLEALPPRGRGSVGCPKKDKRRVRRGSREQKHT